MKACIKNFAYLILIIFSAGLLMSCDAAVLDPRGMIGQSEKELLLVSLGLVLIVIVPTLFLTAYFIWKYREKRSAEHLPDWSYSRKIECAIWLIPIAIIAVLATITWYSTHKLDPYRPLEHDKQHMVIQVVSLDWKWLFIYPDYGIATVGEIAFPVNQPVSFHITSDTVMSSFFIPRLGSQIYTMAGMETKLHLIANKPGVYQGVNTGYSGHGFSDMKFSTVVTDSEQKFEQWIDKARHSPFSLLTKDDFAALAKRSHGYPVTYYASVKQVLFRDIINKYMDMSNNTHGHGCGNQGALTTSKPPECL